MVNKNFKQKINKINLKIWTADEAFMAYLFVRKFT